MIMTMTTIMMITTTMTMTTNEKDPEHLARLTVKVRRLTDPAGAKGHRSSRQRMDQERRVRNLLAGVTLGLALAITGVVASTSPPPETPSQVVIVRGNDTPQRTHIRSKSS